MQRMVKKIKVGNSAGHACTIKFNPNDLCVAIGTSSKQIKYWELQEYNLVSVSTIQDYMPRAICFPNDATEGVCFVAFDDCTRVLKLDDDGRRPKLLDIINKPYH